MRPWLLLAALLAAVFAGRAVGTEAAETPARTCATIGAELAAARRASHLPEVVALYAEAGRPAAGCEPKPLFCLGRSAALAHVEAAYTAAEGGALNEAARLLSAGRAFGSPWPLLVGLGDAATAAARASHDPRRWSEAALAYQQAVAALDAPALCADEPPPPDAAASDAMLRKMALAMLLAEPASFFADRCAPCALAYLAHGPIDPAHPRTLPITFVAGGATLTPEGFAAAKGFAACALALRWNRIDVSVHADERGGAELNRRLSAKRADALRQVLAGTGYAGALQVEAVGASSPLPIDDPAGLSATEIERANRRVELRAIAGEAPGQCTGQEASP